MKLCLFSCCLFWVFSAQAQMLKTNIVEHFTNSNCSICASKNPGIFSDLSMHPNTLHIAYYPSSPYASCFFSMQNPIENDARTNYYGIFGSTPKLIVNGSLVTAANLATSLNSLDLDCSNYSITATQEFVLSDSVILNVKIKKVGSDTSTQASLFVGAIEDSVFQTTGNGESVHQDVFRKSLSIINGDLIALPQMLGDSVSMTYAYKIPANWNAQRMKGIAILQSINTKFVLNAAKSSNIVSTPSTLQYVNQVNNLIYPNPAKDFIFFRESNIDQIEIFSIEGNLLLKQIKPNPSIQINELKSGLYLVKVKQASKVSISKFSIQR